MYYFALQVILSSPSLVISLFTPFPVPAGNQAVPAPPGTFVPYQHLSGRRHPYVVPVERAKRLHRGHLELRLLSGYVLCAA